MRVRGGDRRLLADVLGEAGVGPGRASEWRSCPFDLAVEIEATVGFSGA